MTTSGALLIEGPRSYHLAAPMQLVDEGHDKLTAWAAAREHIKIRPDTAWLMGHFVEADRLNENGYLFGLEDLIQAHPTVVHRPLNMGHHEHHNIGTFVATELLFPANVPASADGVMDKPYVEALASMWKNVYVAEHLAIVGAQRLGASYFSMEAVPASLTCLFTENGVECGQTFPFDGLWSPTYCQHMQDDLRSPKKLNDPRFIGGAVIIPPLKPGWRQADLAEVAANELVRRHGEQAEAIYAHMASESGHLDDDVLEQMMVELLRAVFPGEPAQA